MKFKIVCVFICLIKISFPAVADTISNEGFNFRYRILDQNENNKLFESEYTVMVGWISNYLEDGYDVTFHADFLFTFLAPGLNHISIF